MNKILSILAVVAIACSSSKPKGEVQTLIGTVAVNEDGSGKQVLIEQLEFSRSKVSFDVTGPLKDQVAAKKGKSITVKGEVVKSSPYAGTVEVTEIVK